MSTPAGQADQADQAAQAERAALAERAAQAAQAERAALASQAAEAAQQVAAATGTATIGSAATGTAVSGPILDIRDLSVVYRTPTGDVRAVEKVNLSLSPGEVIGLAGESGSGKSTLAYGATRLLRPPALITAGSVHYNGRHLDGGPADILRMNNDELHKIRWSEIAIVFQSAMNALNPVLRVRDQLLDVIRAHLRLSREQAHDKAATLLDLVGIPRTRLRSYPHELSGGMRQRVMIAMALAADPELVIMDEPTTALDVVVQRDILAQIVELKETLGFAVLFITHDMSLLLELSDRIAVMYAGQLLEVGSAHDMNKQAAHPYTQGLLGSFPSLRGPRRELVGIPGSPPDLRNPPPGCPFQARCRHARPDCAEVEMTLAPVAGAASAAHVTACPFVGPEGAKA
ncbi:MAG TPA: ABC transporter ATP-binding protein [Trebonia sp.]|nr:ABC transporter ATP-binding protein [Trebonia sp.]